MIAEYGRLGTGITVDSIDGVAAATSAGVKGVNDFIYGDIQDGGLNHQCALKNLVALKFPAKHHDHAHVIAISCQQANRQQQEIFHHGCPYLSPVVDHAREDVLSLAMAM